MSELEKITTAWRRLFREGRECALATVVRVTGPAYRRAGARMIVGFDQTGGAAETAGMISGGCLERDVVARAARVIKTGSTELAVYDSSGESDLLLGSATGCGGKIEILVEPAGGPAQADFLEFLSARRETRTSGAAATIISGKKDEVGKRLMLDSAGLCGDTNLLEDADDLRAALQTALDEKQAPQIKRYPANDSTREAREFLVETFLPSPALVIFGAGEDARPLARFASEIGWHVSVVDHRAAFAEPGRFPTVDRIIVSRPEESIDEIKFDGRTLAFLMTHNYDFDREYLRLLLPSKALYVGCLGTKRRTENILRQLQDAGFTTSDEQLSRLYSPAGIDTGAETPEEIAVSILAELRAVLANRSGGFMRNRRSPGRHSESGENSHFSNRIIGMTVPQERMNSPAAGEEEEEEAAAGKSVRADEYSLNVGGIF